MLHRTLTLLTLAAFLLPATALAAGEGKWYLSCKDGSGGKPTKSVTALFPGQWACWQPATSGGDSPLLDLRGCRDNFDLMFWDDETGALTDSTEKYSIKNCSSSGLSDSALDAQCEYIDGVPTSATQADQSALPPSLLRLEADAAGANASSGIWHAVCH